MYSTTSVAKLASLSVDLTIFSPQMSRRGQDESNSRQVQLTMICITATCNIQRSHDKHYLPIDPLSLWKNGKQPHPVIFSNLLMEGESCFPCKQIAYILVPFNMF